MQNINSLSGKTLNLFADNKLLYLRPELLKIQTLCKTIFEIFVAYIFFCYT